MMVWWYARARVYRSPDGTVQLQVRREIPRYWRCDVRWRGLGETAWRSFADEAELVALLVAHGPRRGTVSD